MFSFHLKLTQNGKKERKILRMEWKIYLGILLSSRALLFFFLSAMRLCSYLNGTRTIEISLFIVVAVLLLGLLYLLPCHFIPTISKVVLTFPVVGRCVHLLFTILFVVLHSVLRRWCDFDDDELSLWVSKIFKWMTYE